jgi:hypothetical protein
VSDVTRFLNIHRQTARHFGSFIHCYGLIKRYSADKNNMLMKFQCRVRLQLTSQTRQETRRKQERNLTARFVSRYNASQINQRNSPSSEANTCSASQEIPHILCNPNVHCHVHNCPPPHLSPYPATNKSSEKPFHPTPLWSVFNIIIPVTLTSSNRSLNLIFSYQHSV